MLRSALILICITLLLSCKNQLPEPAGSEAISTDLPQLLDRPEALRNGIEWDNVQNYYGTHSAAIRKNPKDYEARIKLAECFIQEARVTGEHPHYYPAALAMLDIVLHDLETKSNISIREKDLFFQALSHKSGVQLSLHDFKGAKTTATKALALNPYNANIYGCLVDAHVELGEYDAAVSMCDKMVEIRPDLRSYARVSYLREIHGDYKGAIEAMQLAVGAGYPGYEQTEWARLQLGNLYQKYHNPKMAALQYKTALQVRPNYPFALAAQADLAEADGRTAEAIELLKKAIAVIPEVGFYTDLAKIMKKTGNKAALDTLAPQIEIMFKEDKAAGHHVALEEAAFHLHITENIDWAAALIQEELAARPDNIDVNRLAAAIALRQNRKSDAAIFIKKAQRTGSKDPEIAGMRV